jgi:chromosome segregation ATPase
MNEQDLRRRLDEAHRQLRDRDNAYRFHEEELRSRDLLIDQLREQLSETRAWAQELEANSREMQATRAWRFAVWLRSLSGSARGLVRLGR